MATRRNPAARTRNQGIFIPPGNLRSDEAAAPIPPRPAPKIITQIPTRSASHSPTFPPSPDHHALTAGLAALCGLFSAAVIALVIFALIP